MAVESTETSTRKRSAMVLVDEDEMTSVFIFRPHVLGSWREAMPACFRWETTQPFD